MKNVLLVMLLGAAPAFAQIDFSGEWAPIRAEDHTPNPNVLPGDYVGLPISDAARMRADTWSASQWTCLLYTSPSPRDRQKSRMPSSA